MKHQKEETATRLKKAYTEFAQTIKMAEVDHGSMTTWNLGNLASDFDRTVFFGDNYIFPYLKTIVKCIPADEKCWNAKIKVVNGSELDMYYFTDGFTGSFVTASGMSVYYWLHSSGTGMMYYVDINGNKKGPNRLGRDIFVFEADFPKDKFLPYAYQYPRDNIISGTDLSSRSAHACKAGNTGAACASVIMQDSWQIKDDYPW